MLTSVFLHYNIVVTESKTIKNKYLCTKYIEFKLLWEIW